MCKKSLLQHPWTTLSDRERSLNDVDVCLSVCLTVANISA